MINICFAFRAPWPETDETHSDRIVRATHTAASHSYALALYNGNGGTTFEEDRRQRTTVQEAGASVGQDFWRDDGEPEMDGALMCMEGEKSTASRLDFFPRSSEDGRSPRPVRRPESWREGNAAAVRGLISDEVLNRVMDQRHQFLSNRQCFANGNPGHGGLRLTRTEVRW